MGSQLVGTYHNPARWPATWCWSRSTGSGGRGAGLSSTGVLWVGAATPTAEGTHLEAVRRLISTQHQAAGVPERVDVAVPHDQVAEVQRLWVGAAGAAGRLCELPGPPAPHRALTLFRDAVLLDEPLHDVVP